MFLLLALFWASGVMCYCCLHCLLPAGVTVLALLRQYLACRSDAFLLPALFCSCRSDAFSQASRFGSLAEAMQADVEAFAAIPGLLE